MALIDVGRVARWRCGPRNFGGPTWRDSSGKYPGTLTSMTGVGSGWKPTTRPGGYGHLLFDGTDDLVNAGQAAPGTASIAIGAWAYDASGTDTSIYRGVLIKRDDALTSKAAFGFDRQQGSDAGGTAEFRFYFNTSGTWNIWGSSGLGHGKNAWERLLVVYNATGAPQFFRNGVAATSSASVILGTGNPAIPTNTAVTGIGTYAARSGADTPWQGMLDDVTLWGGNPLAVADPAAFAALDFNQTRRNSPGPSAPSVFLMGGVSASGSVGTASGTSTASGAGASTASSTGTASGTSSASGSGAAIDASTGSSSGASTASGAGASTAASVGTASGTSAASGVGSALDASSGTAPGTSSATGAGGSTAASTGTAAGTSTAAGVGSSGSAGSGTGTAYGTSTASGFGSAVDASTGTSSGTSAASGSGGAIHGASGTATGHATATGGGATQTSIPPIVLTPAAWLLFMTRDDSPAITPVDISDDIPDGIRDRFLATDGTAWITGGMTEGLVARKKRAKYYISFHDITGSDTYVTGTPWFVSDRVYQFDCFAPTRAEARKMAELLVDIYHPLAENIPTQAGLIFGMNSLPGGGMGDAGVDSPDATPLYKYTRDFSFSVTRPRSTS